jgi:hypothetical protein
MNELNFTHKGWLLFAPIYMTDPDDPEGLSIEARHPWLEWLVDLAGWVQNAMIFLLSLMRGDEYEPLFWFKCTGPRAKE